MTTTTEPCACDQEAQSCRPASDATFRPRADIREHDDEYVVTLDLPGVRAEDADIRFDDGTLTVRGKVAARQPEGTRSLMREYGVGDYARSFRIGAAIDTEGVHADYARGVLTLRLPKVEAARARKIEVQAG